MKKESTYTNPLKSSLTELKEKGEINGSDVKLIEMYIDGAKYDSTFVNVDGKSFVEILGLAEEKIKNDNVVLDENVLNSLEKSEEIRSTVICANQRVPNGFVVTGYGSSMSCPGWSPSGKNTMTIKRPGNIATVCSNSPVPTGYVVTGYGSSMSCPGWSPSGKNTMTIKKI